MRGALWVYLTPLLGLFAAALLAQALGAAEPMVILAAVSGLIAGFAVVRWHGQRAQRDPQLMPQVLRSAGQAMPLVQEGRLNG